MWFSKSAYGAIAALLLQQTVAQYLAELPAGYDNVNVVLIQDNLAVLPGNWTYETESKHPGLTAEAAADLS